MSNNLHIYRLEQGYSVGLGEAQIDQRLVFTTKKQITEDNLETFCNRLTWIWKDRVQLVEKGQEYDVMEHGRKCCIIEHLGEINSGELSILEKFALVDKQYHKTIF